MGKVTVRGSGLQRQRQRQQPVVAARPHQTQQQQPQQPMATLATICVVNASAAARRPQGNAGDSL